METVPLNRLANPRGHETLLAAQREDMVIQSALYQVPWRLLVPLNMMVGVSGFVQHRSETRTTSTVAFDTAFQDHKKYSLEISRDLGNNEMTVFSILKRISQKIAGFLLFS